MSKTIEEMHDDVAQSTHEEAPPIEAPPIRAPLLEGAATSMACPPQGHRTRTSSKPSIEGGGVKITQAARAIANKSYR